MIVKEQFMLGKLVGSLFCFGVRLSYVQPSPTVRNLTRRGDGDSLEAIAAGDPGSFRVSSNNRKWGYRTMQSLYHNIQMEKYRILTDGY